METGRRLLLGFTPSHQPRRWTLNQVQSRRVATREARPFEGLGWKFVFRAYARSAAPPCVSRKPAPDAGQKETR